MIRTISLLLVCLTTEGIFPQQATPEDTLFFVRVGESYGTVYVPPPKGSANFVFFQGEPVMIELEVFNESSKQSTVLAKGMALKDAFRMVVLEAPSAKPQSELGIEVSPLLKLKLPNVETEARWSEQIVLPPQSGLKVQVKITSGQDHLPAGSYSLKFQCLLKRAARKDIQVHTDTFAFEVRSVETFGDRLEVVRRQAMRLFTTGKPKEADQRLTELLQLYPNSSISYTIKGHIAMSLGKNDEAVRLYQKALDLLQSRMDTIYLNHTPRHVVDEVIGLLTATLRSLQKP